MRLEKTPGEVRGNGASAAATDPVCGMAVDPTRAAGSTVHDGQTYYFCSTGCLHKFRAEPQKFLGGRSVEPPRQSSSCTGSQRPDFADA